MSHDENDPLFEQLRGLPPRRNDGHDPLPKALAAFDRSFGREPSAVPSAITDVGLEPGGTLVARAVVPLALAAVVAGYLLWAFSAAFALQG